VSKFVDSNIDDFFELFVLISVSHHSSDHSHVELDIDSGEMHPITPFDLTGTSSGDPTGPPIVGGGGINVDIGVGDTGVEPIVFSWDSDITTITDFHS
jgi:hypothetical protein